MRECLDQLMLCKKKRCLQRCCQHAVEAVRWVASLHASRHECCSIVSRSGRKRSSEQRYFLQQGYYSMFITMLPHLDPMMFYLATQQNAQTQAVAGAEKTAVAWFVPSLQEHFPKQFLSEIFTVPSCLPGSCCERMLASYITMAGEG